MKNTPKPFADLLAEFERLESSENTVDMTPTEVWRRKVDWAKTLPEPGQSYIFRLLKEQ